MAVYYPRNEKYDVIPEGHEYVCEFTITCHSTDGTPKDIIQYQYRHAIGAVIQTWEQNGYHDSDFCARYYNPETGEFEVTTYASTRYPCSGCHAEVDADEEVRALWDALQEKRKEEDRQRRLAKRAQLCEDCRITEQELERLEYTYAGDMYDGCIRLLKTKKFRSDFRRSLDRQLRDWLSGRNDYRYPFSRKQAQYVH